MVQMALPSNLRRLSWTLGRSSSHPQEPSLQHAKVTDSNDNAHRLGHLSSLSRSDSHETMTPLEWSHIRDIDDPMIQYESNPASFTDDSVLEHANTSFPSLDMHLDLDQALAASSPEPTAQCELPYHPSPCPETSDTSPPVSVGSSLTVGQPCRSSDILPQADAALALNRTLSGITSGNGSLALEHEHLSGTGPEYSSRASSAVVDAKSQANSPGSEQFDQPSRPWYSPRLHIFNRKRRRNSHHRGRTGVMPAQPDSKHDSRPERRESDSNADFFDAQENVQHLSLKPTPEEPGDDEIDLAASRPSRARSVVEDQLADFNVLTAAARDEDEDFNSFAGSQRYLQFLAASAQDNEDDVGDAGDDDTTNLRRRSSIAPSDHRNLARRASIASSVHSSLSEGVQGMLSRTTEDPDDTAGPELIEKRQKDRIFSYSQVREAFEMPEDESIVNDFSAWFVRDVMIQGHIFNTERAIYFLAHLPLRSSNVIKASNLRKKSSRSVGWTRYWFVLRQNTFSYYTSASDIYFPSGTIDLSKALYAAVDNSSNGEQTNSFSIVTENKTYTLKADTANSAHEWAKSLQKEIFRLRNRGDLVKIRIPWPNVVKGDFGQMGDLVKLMRLTVVGDPATRDLEVFVFSLFHMADMSILSMRSMISDFASSEAAFIDANEELILKKDATFTESVFSTAHDSGRPIQVLTGLMPQRFSLPNDGPSDDSTRNATTMGMLSSMAKVPKTLVTGAVETLIPGVGNDDDRVASESSSATKVSDTKLSMRETFAGLEATSGSGASSANNSAPPTASASPVIGPHMSKHLPGVPSLHNIADKIKHMVDDHEGDPDNGPAEEHFAPPKIVGQSQSVSTFSLSTGSTLLTPSASKSGMSQEALAEANSRFRSIFSFGNQVMLVASYLGHVTHQGDHLYGKIYISNEFLTFRRLGLGAEALMIVPLDDIEDVKESHLRRGSGHAAKVINPAYGSIVFDFPHRHSRLDFIKVLRDVREQRALFQRNSSGSGELPTEEEVVTLNLRSARLCTYEQIVNSQMDVKVPPVIIDPVSDEAHEFFLAKPMEPLRITMLTIGSRGDVQPYIALSQGLMKEGHKCKIATHLEFKDFVEEYGIEFAEVAGNPKELMEIMIEHGSFSVAFLRDAASKFRGWVGDLLDTAWTACQDSDLLIESPSAMAGIHIAEALRIPYFRAFTMPWTRTRAYPHAFIVPEQNLGGSYNYLTYVMFDNLLWRGIAGKVNAWRKKTLHLPKTSLEDMKQQQVPFLYCVSPSILVPPTDEPDWIHITGYWFLDDDKGDKSDPKVAEFIKKARDDGKKIVYIGFGSIVVSDAEAMTKAVIEAVESADVRCILAKGWSTRGQSDEDKKKPEVPLPDSIYAVDSIDHTWLFPQIDAAVHHGGSGTTGASLRWGLPTVIKPFFGDQFFYAHRVEDLNCGVHLSKLTASSLAKALKDTTSDEKMIAKARAIGEHIRREHGVANAIFNIYREMSYARSLIKGRPAEPPGRPADLRSPSMSPDEIEEHKSGDYFAHGSQSQSLRNIVTHPHHLWPQALNPFKSHHNDSTPSLHGKSG